MIPASLLRRAAPPSLTAADVGRRSHGAVAGLVVPTTLPRHPASAAPDSPPRQRSRSAGVAHARLPPGVAPRTALLRGRRRQRASRIASPTAPATRPPNPTGPRDQGRRPGGTTTRMPAPTGGAMPRCGGLHIPAFPDRAPQPRTRRATPDRRAPLCHARAGRGSTPGQRRLRGVRPAPRALRAARASVRHHMRSRSFLWLPAQASRGPVLISLPPPRRADTGRDERCAPCGPALGRRRVWARNRRNAAAAAPPKGSPQ
ncbi:MAG: hypothetical protein WCJ55_00170 [Chloroflexales bacterium]